MQEELFNKLSLSIIPGIGGNTFKQLISYFGTAEAVFASNAYKIKRIPGLGDHVYLLIKNSETKKRAEIVIKECERQSIQILFYTDSNYPKRLKVIQDAPVVLYTKGQMNLNAEKIISIVGTRNASTYGLEVTKKIIEDLKKHDALILSGLAYGIDIAAHRFAMKENMMTVGAIAGGIDKIYPASHKGYAEKMQKHGGLITEHPPGVIPDAPKFPARNRIIAGMADAVIVVEAAAKGGALITAELADGYNKDVFAVPGNIFNTYSEGCNALIKNHKANLYSSVADLEYYLNWDIEKEQTTLKQIDYNGMNDQEISVIKLLNEFDSIIIDELAWKSQIPMHQLASVLLNLEFQGLVNSLPGKKFALSKIYK